MMKLSCCVWALSLPENEMLQAMKNIGFEWIDIQPHMLQSADLRSLAIDLNLKVSCVGISFNMPDGASLDHDLESNRQQAIEHCISAMAHAVDLGADCVYVVPCMDDSSDALARYGLSLQKIADKAGEHDLKVCIEHFPGRALATASASLDFIKQVDHPNLYLLLDSGHIQMSKEDAQDIIMKAGSKLGYVHFDDNDGENDVHWSLLDGVMTTESLKQTFQALNQIDYSGAISLELSPKLSAPAESLIKSRDILLDVIESLG